MGNRSKNNPQWHGHRKRTVLRKWLARMFVALLLLALLSPVFASVR